MTESRGPVTMMLTLHPHSMESRSALPCPLVDANHSTSGDSTWLDKGPNGNHATRHGSPTVIPNGQNNLSLIRYSGSNGEYHSFSNLSNIRTVFWVWKNSGGYYFMLGDNNQYHFHKGVLMFDSGWTSSNISNGFLKLKDLSFL